MEQSISAADANRSFSRLLQTVKGGQSVTVTSHGKPVARLAPAGERETGLEAARAAHFARLRKQRPVTIGRWTRDELYDEQVSGQTSDRA